MIKIELFVPGVKGGKPIPFNVWEFPAGIVDGQLRAVAKDPITDDGTKKSAEGLLSVNWVAGELKLTDKVPPEQYGGDAMREVFRDGKVLICEDWETVRDRIKV